MAYFFGATHRHRYICFLQNTYAAWAELTPSFYSENELY